MALRLILVRHGETIWNREDRYQGQSDTPLSPEGIRQAELISARLKNELLSSRRKNTNLSSRPENTSLSSGRRTVSLSSGYENASPSAWLGGRGIDAIYSSDLQRSMVTAAIIAQNLNLEVNPEPGLREIGFGEWEGLTFEEIEKAYGVILQAWLNDPLNTAPPGGEDFRAFSARVMDAVGHLMERPVKYLNASRPNSDSGPFAALVVTHGGPIRVIVAHALGLSPGGIWGFSIDHASLSVVDFFEGGSIIRSLNDTCHLHGAGR